MVPPDFSNDDNMPSRTLFLVAGLVLLLQGFSIFAPMAVLGGAIQWPDSLDFPPSQMLPLLREQLGAVRLGYGLYLGYSLLFLVTGVLTVRLAVRPGALGALALIAIGAAAVSALARCIGILRWLTGSASLADAHAAPGLSARLCGAQCAGLGRVHRLRPHTRERWPEGASLLQERARGRREQPPVPRGVSHNIVTRHILIHPTETP